MGFIVISLVFLILIVYVGLWIYDIKEIYSAGNKSFNYLMNSSIFRDLLKVLVICLISLLIVNLNILSSVITEEKYVLWFISGALSLLISYIWFHHINQLDVFEPENYQILLMIFISGAACSYLVYPLTDLYNFIVPTRSTDSLWQGLFWAITRIGLIEEFVKIIPLFLLWKFTKILNEPFDFLLFGAISALGFAFVENTMYLTNSELTAISGRALFASPMHLFLTSMIGYRVALAIYAKKNVAQAAFFAFLISSIIHGFYDFWLIDFDGLGILSLFMLLLALKASSRMLNTGLNISPFYRSIIINPKKFKYSLSTYFALLLSLAYVAKNMLSTSSEANDLLFQSLFFYSYLTAFVGINFAGIRVIPGYTIPLLDRDFNVFRQLLPLGVNQENCSGTHITLTKSKHAYPTKKGTFLKSYLPCSIHLLHPAIVDDDNSFYLAELKSPIPFTNYLSTHILINSMNTDYSLCSGRKVMAEVYAIKEINEGQPGVFTKKGTLFISNIRIRVQKQTIKALTT